jgi:hypothetical protein
MPASDIRLLECGVPNSIIQNFLLMRKSTNNIPDNFRGCPTTAMWVYRVGMEKAKRLLLTGV